jgi:hypothetical protein
MESDLVAFRDRMITGKGFCRENKGWVSGDGGENAIMEGQTDQVGLKKG